MTAPATTLHAIRTAHTIVWAFFVLTIGAIWVLAWTARLAGAAGAIAIVLVEVAVLGLNRGQCPLTPIAARYTDDRRANFDIYLPEWLARNNKAVFGSLYVVAILFLAARWLGSR